jgi:transcriptional regulator with XRE-family HTH domain
MNELGNRLSDLLASSDTSQRKLAKQIGVSNATISRIINGDGGAMLKTVIAIADYFSVSLEWLVGRE